MASAAQQQSRYDNQKNHIPPLRLPILASLLGLCLVSTLSAATLLDVWKASDLSGTHTDGAIVSSWASASNRVSSVVSAGQEPTFTANATPSGKPTVKFNGKLMRTGGADNPVAGRPSFTLAYVFKASAVGDGAVAQWWNNSGIVDAEEGGATADWGTAINGSGQIAFGIGNADTTVYSPGASVVDGQYHVVVVTWGGGVMSLYLDNRSAATATGVATASRNAARWALASCRPT